MNICYITPGLLIVASILCALLLGKPWVLPRDSKDSIIRSIIVGLSIGFAVFNILLIFVTSNMNESCLNFYVNSRISIVACISVPLGIISIIGQYLKFRQQSWFDPNKNKIGLKQKVK